MKKLYILAAICMAALLNACAGSPSAPPATPDSPEAKEEAKKILADAGLTEESVKEALGAAAGLPADTDAGTQDPKSEAPKEPSSFFFGTMTQGINAFPFFVNFVGQDVGIAWAGTVQGTLTESGTKIENEEQRKAAAKILDNIPKGTKDNFSLLGEKKMNSDEYKAWLDARDCKFVSYDQELELEKWTPGCDTAAEQENAELVKAIAASTADPVIKGNAEFTRGMAMKMTAGDEKLAMLHLAALMLPFTEWSAAFGLTDDLNLLNGKPACFSPTGAEARCGIIEKADANGVTINGETVPWDKILGKEGPGLHLGDMERFKAGWNKGGSNGGGTNNAGLGIQPQFRIMGTILEDQTNLTLLAIGPNVVYTLETFPFTFLAGLGFMGSPGGAVADHYTELAKGGDRMDFYVQAGAGLRPKFLDWLGMSAMVNGMFTSSGGGAFLVDLGPEFYVAPWVAISPAFSAGYLDWGHEGGSNDTSNLPDPPVRGGTVGGSLTATFTIPGTK